MLRRESGWIWLKSEKPRRWRGILISLIIPAAADRPSQIFVNVPISLFRRSNPASLPLQILMGTEDFVHASALASLSDQENMISSRRILSSLRLAEFHFNALWSLRHFHVGGKSKLKHELTIVSKIFGWICGSCWSMQHLGDVRLTSLVPWNNAKRSYFPSPSSSSLLSLLSE